MEIDWKNVKRVLVVRLRSIGDTVLATPSLIALRRFLPDAQIDVLLEDWAAPVLDGFNVIDKVIRVSRKNKKSRLEAALEIRRNRYDVAFNLHGGTTGTFFVRASGAKYRVGFAEFSYGFLYTHLLDSPADFWHKKEIHSAENQLALLGSVGVPVADKPKSRLVVTEKARIVIDAKLKNSQFALFHPAAAFATKQWATENFAQTAEFLHEKGLTIIAVAAKNEREVLENLQKSARVPISIFDDLTLPEITALASRAKLFVGNDSGIAHIAAAVGTPTVVIFGASNINVWHPWTDAPSEIVHAENACGHQIGEIRKGSENPKCILCVTVGQVRGAITKILRFKN